MVIYTNECSLQNCKDRLSNCHCNLHRSENIIINNCNKQGKHYPDIIDTTSMKEAVTYTLNNNKNLSLEETLQLLKLKAQFENQA